MQDQMLSLNQRGLHAAQLSSSVPECQQAAIMHCLHDNLTYSHIKKECDPSETLRLLYVTPERLATQE